MATAGKHAHIGLYYYGSLNKDYLVNVLNAVKAANKKVEGEGFGAFSFVDADAFVGGADTRFDAILIEGSVPEALSDRIEATYTASGREVRVLTDRFEDEFREFERLTENARNGVTSDPPRSQTDNVTASRSSPMAHVETDGRNDPRVWTGATGTSLDRFGLPLATTDGPLTSAADRRTGLDAQSDAVSQRTAEAAAAEQERLAKEAEARDAEAAQKIREAEAKKEADRVKKAEADAEKARKAEEAKKNA